MSKRSDTRFLSSGVTVVRTFDGRRVLVPNATVHGGVLVVAGIHAQPVPIDLTALVRRHQQLRGSYRAPEAAWPEVVAALVRHQGVLQHMVTHTLPLAQALDGIALARDKQATKVVVLP